MGNLLTNAGFLEGLAPFQFASGTAAAVDEIVRGGPGRAALVVSNVLAANASFDMGVNVASCPAVSAGDLIEVSGLVRVNGPGEAQVSLAICASNGTVLKRTPLEGPISASASPVARRGVPRTFDRWWGLVTAEQSGLARWEASVVAYAPGTVELSVVKPFLGAAQSQPWATTWDPGLHVTPDLQLPSWPSSLRPFANSSNPTPVANAKSFTTDANIPVREDLYAGQHYDFKGQIRVAPDELADLEDFYSANRGDFFMVDPFTDRLCIAQWTADGAPAFVSDEGETATYQVGMHLTVA